MPPWTTRRCARARSARARAPADHAAPSAERAESASADNSPAQSSSSRRSRAPRSAAQEGATIGGPPAREVRLERLEVGGRGGHQPAGHLGQAELVHVEVADRGGEVAEPLELRLPRLPDVRRERRPAELEQRAGPPDRYPDVVEELGVNVADRAREVVAHLLEEFGQLGGEQRTRRRLGVGHRGARGPGRDRLVRGRLEQGRDQPPRPVGLLLVAAQRPDSDHGRRRGTTVGGLVDVEAHHDLAVRVAQLGAVHQPSALVDDEQGADPGQSRNVVLQRPVRQRTRHRRPPRPGAGQHAHQGLPTLHQLEPLFAGLGDELQPLTGTFQAPVERVQRRAPHHPRFADRHLEGRGQQVVQALEVERRGTGRAGTADLGHGALTIMPPVGCTSRRPARGRAEVLLPRSAGRGDAPVIARPAILVREGETCRVAGQGDLLTQPSRAGAALVEAARPPVACAATRGVATTAS